MRSRGGSDGTSDCSDLGFSQIDGAHGGENPCLQDQGNAFGKAPSVVVARRLNLDLVQIISQSIQVGRVLGKSGQGSPIVFAELDVNLSEAVLLQAILQQSGWENRPI